MRKGKVARGFLAVLAACTMFSMTALAEEKAEIEEIMISPEIGDEVQAGGHGFIYTDEFLDGSVYSNNTKITLKFHGSSLGNKFESYQIRVYRGESADGSGEALDGASGDFPARGSFDIEFTLDTTGENREAFPEGKYTVICTSYYEVSGTRVQHFVDSATFEIEDYRRVKDREFVNRLYQKVFGRQGDAAGVADWTNKLFEGKTTGASTVEGFFMSEEFTKKNTSDRQYVDLLYEAIFNRSADEGGRQNWLNVLSQGVSRKYVLAQFVDSVEFTNLCDEYGIIRGSLSLTENRDKNVQVTGFVNRLYAIAMNRPADVGGLNDWTGRLLEKKQTPKQVASGFVFSKEMSNRNLSNAEFVTMLYRTMMDREPDAAGLQDWVNRLENGAKREDIYDGFADSVEFGRIVSSYGL